MEYGISRRVVVSWMALTGLLFALVIVRSPGVGAQAVGPGLEVVRVGDWTPVPPGDVEAAEATCPEGMKIIGGDFSAIGRDATMRVAIALPVDGRPCGGSLPRTLVMWAMDVSSHEGSVLS